MALNRVWIPSPNYSSRGGTGVRLIVVHTAEGATTYESLGSFFANPSSGVSSHTGIDDNDRNEIGEYVNAVSGKAWTAANANPYSVQTELCGFASWDGAEWSRHPAMLATCAAWIAEESARFDIPIRKLSEAEAAAGQAGVVGHADLGYAGNDHWDPGPNFPWGDVLAMAGGQDVVLPAPSSSGVPLGDAPPFPGVALVNFHRGDGTATWQQAMVSRGWGLTVDDLYGDESEAACRAFQAEKALADVDGIVGPETWAATWTAPVT